jgi:hypothetical protein
VEYLREEMWRADDKAAKRRRVLGIWPPPDVVFEGREFRVFEVPSRLGSGVRGSWHRWQLCVHRIEWVVAGLI